MTEGPPKIAPEAAKSIWMELPLAVVVADLNGKIMECNARAHRVYSPRGGTASLEDLEEWQPRNGTLARALRLIASSSSWSPIALSRGDERFEMRGRGILMDGVDAPLVLLMENNATPHSFAQHSEQVRRLNAQLVIQSQTEDRLRAALRTAEDLRRELAHRVKNNLAIVSALLRTKARVAEHPAAAEALTAAAARVRSIALVHELLDVGGEAEILSSKAIFTALLDQLRESICPSGITLEEEIFDTALSSEIALPLCLLVNELVTNAIKHAFADRSSGCIRVTFAVAGERFRLSVTDNGSGIGSGTSSPGSGSRIIEALVQQLNGELVLEQRAGTSWAISLPLLNSADLTAFKTSDSGASASFS